MNILASYDWLKEYVDLKGITPQQFAARVSLSGPGVERLYPQGKDLEGIVVGYVKEVGPHPNADKLRIANVDLGSTTATIVCGGSNLAQDQWVAVAKIGAKVKWHGEGEMIELAPAEIRGVKSEGMICAANEIGLYDAFPHQEREIVDLGKELPDMKLKPGTPLADALGLSDDTVMDIEVTSNRPDAFSIVGLAREASSILNKKLEWKPSKLPKAGKSKLSISVQDKKLCPRYMAVKIDGVKAGSSPWWMKRRLLSSGIRPINTLVDITNFVMLELGQPMHVFDAAKLEGSKIIVRQAKKGESFPALDGKTYSLKEGMLVIADAEKPQAVAGVMGSETSAVSLDTQTIIFEAASFNEVSVRRTARALNLYSDSQLRFEKGLSTQAPVDALARAVELCLELCGGEVSSAIYDSQTVKYSPVKYSISFAKIDELIGVPIKKSDAVSMLKRLGFEVKANAKQLSATVPWWRDHDIESGRDLVEEISRLNGYANLPVNFPGGITKRATDPELVKEHLARQLAKGAGFAEIFTYSFTSKAMQEKAGFDPSVMLAISNPLTTDFEVMRTSLLPSMLDALAENQGRFRSQHLFEIAHAYLWTDKTKLPDEKLEMAAGIMGGDNAWKEAKGLVELKLQNFGIKHVEWKRVSTESFWHPGRTAQAFDGEHLLATVGEIHPTLAESYKFDNRVALAHVMLEEVFERANLSKGYTPIPQYPESKRDLALTVSSDVSSQDIISTLRKTSPLIKQVEWFDTYRGEGLGRGKKSVAFHLTIGADDRTLQTGDVDQVLELAIQQAKNAYGAESRS